MGTVFTTLESIFHCIVEYSILLIEFIGVSVLLVSIFRAVYGVITKNKNIRLDLAEGIALSLEFKMGGELLRTLIVRDWSELLILGAIILLRAALTFLINWEISIEKKKNV